MYLFSLIYELDVCNVGDPFVLDVCRDTERIKLINKNLINYSGMFCFVSNLPQKCF